MDGGKSIVSRLCKRCRNKVVNGFKCTECENWFHVSCAKNCSSVKFIDENTIKCCVVESDNDDLEICEALTKIADGDGKIDVKVLKFILKQKECVVYELKEKVKILLDQVNFLTQQLNNKPVDEKKQLQMTSDNIHTVNKTQNIKIQSQKDYSKNLRNVDKCVEKGESSEVMRNEVIQNNTKGGVQLDQEDAQQLEWAEVVKKNMNKYERKPILYGSGSSKNLKVALKEPRKKAVFVSRLAPEVSVQELFQYIDNEIVKPIKITKLKTKYESYSSFHVEIEEEKFDEMFNDKHWPEGCLVCPFYGKLRNEQIVLPPDNEGKKSD